MYTKKDYTEKEIVQIAFDLYKGKIFCNQHIPKERNDLLMKIFTWLAIMPEEEFEAINLNPPGLIFEYKDKSNRLFSFEGYPFFVTLQMFSAEETEKMWSYFDEFKRIDLKYKSN